MAWFPRRVRGLVCFFGRIIFFDFLVRVFFVLEVFFFARLVLVLFLFFKFFFGPGVVAHVVVGDGAGIDDD